ncbi:MAG: TonB-dependent receptor [Bryobacterales bacterium]|nr:TonB-dependent receptor [Bryobacterales bacterium]
MKKIIGSLLPVFFGVSLCLPVSAQETTGVILGTVKDSSGALIPGAKLTITERTTGSVRNTAGDAQGFYIVPALPPGTYSVAVECPGMQRSVRNNVQVQITERVPVNFVLNVGSLEEVVTVSAAPPVVQMETAAQGRVITGTSIRAIPLSTRNYTHLLALTAGVSSALNNADSPGLGNVNPNVNGMRAGSNNLLIDGLPAYNALNNSNTGIGAPSPDFLQEFKVMTSMFSAEYGRNAGSVVNVVTVSGSNQLHGSAWDFLRNTKLNARPFFAAARGQNNQNQFGFSVGGPVLLPKIYSGKDRTFFFFGYEGTRQRNSNSSAALSRQSVPTAAMRAGTYSKLVRDPLIGLPCSAADGRGCFPGNQIPTSRIDSISRAVMDKFIPLPNASTGGPVNFVEARPISGGNDQYVTRLDHNFSGKDRFTGRWFWSKTPQTDPFGSSPFPGMESRNTRDKYDLALSYTRIISPNLINEGRLGWDRSVSLQSNSDQTDPRSLGLPATNTMLGFPRVSISSYFNFGITETYRDNAHLFTLTDTLTWLRGKHAIKFGGEVRQGRIQPMSTANQRPSWTFSGQSTSDGFADFLLDVPSRGVYGAGAGILNLRENAYNLFATDDFKITSNLTLNLGVRYELNVPPYDTQIKLVSFWPDRYTRLGSSESAGVVVGGVTSGVPAATAFTDKKTIGPRFGFAWSPGGGRTVVRGGYGIYFDQRTAQVFQQLRSNPPLTAVQTLNFAAGGVSDRWAYRVQGLDPNALPVPTASTSFTLAAIEKDPRTDTAQQWNLDLQRELPGRIVLQGAYVGTHGTHLFLRRNINYARPDAAGVFARPFAGYGPIWYQGNNGNSIYHSGQFTAQKRFSGGSQFLAAYTISKTIDDAAGTSRYYASANGDPNNFRRNRGLSTFDRPQRLTLSFNLALPNPFQKGTSPVRHVFAGWEVSGVGLVQSGVPFNVTNSLSGQAWDGDIGSGGAGFADYVGGSPYTAGSTKQRLSGYLAKSAFAAAPRTRFGTLGRNALRGPGQANLDFAVQKRFTLRENLGLNFRTEFFNLSNRANFSNPSGSFDSSTFGVISSTNANARIIQFGLKLTY